METQAIKSEQNQGFTNRQKIAGYIGIFLLSLFVFLTLKFPYELLTQGILSRLKSQFPVPITAESAIPRLPLGIKFEKVKIGSFSPQNQAVISLDSLTIKAALFKALSQKIDAEITAGLNNGSLKIFIKGTKTAADVTFKADNFGVALLKEIMPNVPLKVDGEISGNGKMKINTADPLAASGEFHFNSANLGLKNVDLRVTKADFHFKHMEANLVLERGGMLKVNSLVMEGDPCGFEITGAITVFPKQIGQSELNLELSLHPTAEFEKQFPLGVLQKDSRGFPSGKLHGTLARPQFP